jgi:hypothetical protein
MAIADPRPSTRSLERFIRPVTTASTCIAAARARVRDWIAALATRAPNNSHANDGDEKEAKDWATSRLHGALGAARRGYISRAIAREAAIISR